MIASIEIATAPSFADKWLARWPEWRIGSAFLPASQRALAMAWFALLQEFTLAAWIGDDATPGLAKLAWWNEELIGWSKGARRHPLGEVLLPVRTEWSALASTLRALQATRERGLTAIVSDSGLQAFAAAVWHIETDLFDVGIAMDGASPRAIPAAAIDRVAFDLLAERILLHGDARVAAGLIAASGPPRPLPAGALPRGRRIQSAFASARLRRLADGRSVQPAGPLRSLQLAWRAARG